VLLYYPKWGQNEIFLGEVGLLGLCERSEKWGNGVKRGPVMAAQWQW
jgi:hypothetical protein